MKQNPSKTEYEVHDEWNWGPLHHAVVSNNPRCVKVLLSIKDLNTKEKTNKGYTALHLAIRDGAFPPIIKLLVDANPELVNIPNNEKDYPLHQLVNRNKLNAIRVLFLTLKRKNQPIKDHVNILGETAAMLAASQRNLEMLNYLLANMECDYKWTLFSIIVSSVKDVNIIPLLETWLPIFYDYDAQGRSLVPQLLVPISYSYQNIIARDWFLHTFYLTDDNLERPLVEQFLTEFREHLADERINDILFSLHSDISPEVSNTSKPILSPLLSDVYSVFYKIFLTNRDLFDVISVAYLAKFKKSNSVELCVGFVKFIEKTIETLGYDRSVCLEFLDKFSIDPSFDTLAMVEYTDSLHVLQFCKCSEMFCNELFSLALPFSAISCKHEFFKEVQHNINPLLCPYRRDKIKIDWKLILFNDNLERPPKLLDLSVAAVRKWVFSQKKSSEEDTVQMKLKRLMSLEVPISVKNLLRFNTSNYVFKH